MLWPAPEFRVRLRRARNGPASEAHSAEMRFWKSLRLQTEGQATATLGSSPLFLISRSRLSPHLLPTSCIKLSCGGLEGYKSANYGGRAACSTLPGPP